MKALSKLLDAVRWFIVVPIGLMLFPMALKQTLMTVLILMSVLG